MNRALLFLCLAVILPIPTAAADVAPPSPVPPDMVLSASADFPKMVFVLYRIDRKKEAAGAAFPADPASALVLGHDGFLSPVEGAYLTLAVPAAVAEKAKGGADPTWLDGGAPGVIHVPDVLRVPHVFREAILRYELVKTDKGPRLNLLNPDELARARERPRFAGAIESPPSPPTVSGALAMGEGLLLFSTLLAGCFLFLWLLHAQPSPPAPEDEAVNASLVTTGRGIVGLCGVLLAAAMFLMPPWQDLLIPPFGSGQQFAGYSPVFWPPHNPWTLPPLADRPFANAQHEYRKDWTLFLVQVLAVGLVTVAAMVVLPGRFLAGIASHQTTGSQGGAILGGIGALAIGLIGATAIMAPLLEAVPRGRVATTLLLLAGYLGAILGGCLIGARLGHASMARVLAGAAAGQLAVAYLVFVLLPDASPGSHRLLLLVWELATLGGLAVGVVWAKRNCNAPAAAVNAVSGFGDRADRG